MEAARLIRTARVQAGLTLRALGALAGTSHSTLAAYEADRKTPNVATLDRILRAAGYQVDVTLRPDRPDRGSELLEVLTLAEMFPARHASTMTFPKFGVVVTRPKT